MESLGVTIKVGVDRSFADEVYSLLGSIGFKKYTSYYPTKSSPWVYTNNNGNIMHCSFKADNDIEVDINQLRDLVVLKRNDVGDSTHIDQDNWKWYIGADSYVWQAGNAQQLKQWDKSSLDHVDLKPITKVINCTFDEKPIEKTMKEYLDKDYVLRHVKQTSGDNHVPEEWIEVPVGANNDFNGLDKSEINHRVAKAFNVIRGTDLNEDDIHFLRQLIYLTTSHYWDRK